MTVEKYDSTQDTLDHIATVRNAMEGFAHALYWRGRDHDASKLTSPEKEMFDEYTPKLRAMTYDSPEYRACLEEMKKTALAHHYEHNSHHPEHYEDGIRGMNLFDLVEMFCDWMAAVKRHADGDLLESIRKNKERFALSDDLVAILENTAKKIDHDGFL